jgi:bifunctional non-homologous end joining protein LigD
VADTSHIIDLGGRLVRLTNLTKVMYPSTGLTKVGVVDYYRRVAPAILGQVRDRPVTRIRYPEGVAGERFFEKNVPAGAPEWLRRQTLRASPIGDEDGTEVEYPFIDDLAALVWAANQGALELHTPQWRVGPRGRVHNPDRLVIDLDPGAPAGLDECARVAVVVAHRLAEDGLVALPVTSGGKGMQLYANLDGRRDAVTVREYVHTVANELAKTHPRLVVSVMRKELRRGKVLLDWSQNHPAKTTITPYSLRGGALPTVAAPRTWDEIEPEALQQLTADEVAARYERDGDLLAG